MQLAKYQRLPQAPHAPISINERMDKFKDIDPDRFIVIRPDEKITVKDMQMIFGFATPQAIYKWIHGTSMPTIDNLVILAAVLGVSMDEIVVVGTVSVKCG